MLFVIKLKKNYLIFGLNVESDNISVTSSASGQYYGNHVNKEPRSSITSSNYYGGQLSATESSRGDDVHDDTDNESLGGGKL